MVSNLSLPECALIVTVSCIIYKGIKSGEKVMEDKSMPYWVRIILYFLFQCIDIIALYFYLQIFNYAK